jgi:glycosyltransferase involved in cell wall biosynthesis
VTFDLVVATVGRVGDLTRLFTSLEQQTHPDFRILLVDQNEDDRLEGVVAGASLRVERLRSARGLSLARNVALPHLDGDVVAFPDDDCTYPPDLLERVARRLEADSALDGLTGREPSWTSGRATLTRENLWKRAISFTIFLRREVVERVGEFDQTLGLPSSSGEEFDYLIRALDLGAKLEYDPSLVVLHEQKPDADSFGGREGASLGYLLRKHGYPRGTVTRMIVRPAGGAVVALARGDRRRARFQLDTLRGRVRGYRS